MADIIGTGGQDDLHGTSGDDTIRGLRGDDFIYGRGGDDLLIGGAGGDVIGDVEDPRKFALNGDDRMFGGDGNDQLLSLNGADTLIGGAGDDDLVIYRQQLRNDDRIIANGGNGDDTFYLSSYNAGQHVSLSGGAGNDYFELWGSKGTLHIDLGAAAGADTVWAASRYVDGDGPVVIGHFQAGAGGDLFVLDPSAYGGFLDGFGETYDGDPFADGLLRLVQHGSNAILEVSTGGGWSVSMIFRDAQAADFTADNFSGYDPHPAGFVA